MVHHLIHCLRYSPLSAGVDLQSSAMISPMSNGVEDIALIGTCLIGTLRVAVISAPSRVADHLSAPALLCALALPAHMHALQRSQQDAHCACQCMKAEESVRQGLVRCCVLSMQV